MHYSSAMILGARRLGCSGCKCIDEKVFSEFIAHRRIGRYAGLNLCRYCPVRHTTGTYSGGGTPYGPLVRAVLIVTMAVRCAACAVDFVKMHQNAPKLVFGRDSAPDPAGGAYDVPRHIVGWEGVSPSQFSSRPHRRLRRLDRLTVRTNTSFLQVKH